MNQLRIAVFVDFANIHRACSERGLRLDYEDFLWYLAADRYLVDAIAYVPIDPRAPTATDADIEELWLSGYVVKSKKGKKTEETFKCNFDVEMTIDILNAALEMDLDVVILVSGDGDFVPVAEYLRGRGIRIEVCGFEATLAHELVLKSSGCIDVDNYFCEEVEEGADEADE